MGMAGGLSEAGVIVTRRLLRLPLKKTIAEDARGSHRDRKK